MEDKPNQDTSGIDIYYEKEEGIRIRPYVAAGTSVHTPLGYYDRPTYESAISITAEDIRQHFLQLVREIEEKRKKKEEKRKKKKQIKRLSKQHDKRIKSQLRQGVNRNKKIAFNKREKKTNH